MMLKYTLIKDDLNAIILPVLFLNHTHRSRCCVAMVNVPKTSSISKDAVHIEDAIAMTGLFLFL